MLCHFHYEITLSLHLDLLSIQGLAQVSTSPVSTFTVCNSIPHTHSNEVYMCSLSLWIQWHNSMQWQIPHALSLLCQFQLSFSYKIHFHLVIIFNRHGHTDDNLISRAYTTFPQSIFQPLHQWPIYRTTWWKHCNIRGHEVGMTGAWIWLHESIKWSLIHHQLI